MGWKLFATTYLAIFIAELGDKTQLAAFALGGQSSSRWLVFLAASLALITTTAIAVWTGGAITRVVPEHWIRRGAGALFVILGVIMLVTATGPAAADDAPASDDDAENASTL